MIISVKELKVDFEIVNFTPEIARGVVNLIFKEEVLFNEEFTET